MIALYIFLGIIALLLILLILPIRVHLHYEDELSVNLRYAFLNFHIYPPKDKKEKKEMKEFEKESKKEEKKAKRSLKEILKINGVTDAVDLICNIAKIACGLLEDVVKHTKIKKLYFNMPVNGDDAGDVAIKYGHLSGLVYSSYAVIKAKFKKVETKSFFIYPNFNNVEDKAEVSLVIRIIPLFILNTFVKAIFKYIKYNSKRQKNKDKLNGSKSGINEGKCVKT